MPYKILLPFFYAFLYVKTLMLKINSLESVLQ